MTLRCSFNIWRRISDETDIVFSIYIIIWGPIASGVIASVIISNKITDLKCWVQTFISKVWRTYSIFPSLMNSFISIIVFIFILLTWWVTVKWFRLVLHSTLSSVFFVCNFSAIHWLIFIISSISFIFACFNAWMTMASITDSATQVISTTWRFAFVSIWLWNLLLISQFTIGVLCIGMQSTSSQSWTHHTRYSISTFLRSWSWLSIVISWGNFLVSPPCWENTAIASISWVASICWIAAVRAFWCPMKRLESRSCPTSSYTSFRSMISELISNFSHYRSWL